MLIDKDIEKTWLQIINNTPRLSIENITILEALGRVSAANVYAPTNLPSNRQSAVDGYALANSKDDTSNSYTLIGSIGLGEVFNSPLQAGEALGVGTGGDLPEGAVTVIPHENTEIQNGIVIPTMSIKIGNNIKEAGEDYRNDDLLIKEGHILGPGELSLLAAFGITEVQVFSRPKVGIFSLSGNVVPYNGTPLPGKIRDSNGPLLSALVKQDGGITTIINIAEGQKQDIKQSLLDLSEQVDIIIITGGTYSEYDNEARSLMEDIGTKLLYWGVPIQPGSHTGAGRLNSCMIFALSGNPTSCAVGYYLFVGTAIREMQGLNPYLPRIKAICTNGFPKKTGSRRLVRGYASYDGEGFKVTVQPGQKPSMLRSLIECNAFIDLPANYPPVEEGQEVTILLLNTLYDFIKF